MSLDGAEFSDSDHIFDDGVLGDEYELIGVYNDCSDEGSGSEYEIFIVAGDPVL